jgi:hypothetical protein
VRIPGLERDRSINSSWERAPTMLVSVCDRVCVWMSPLEWIIANTGRGVKYPRTLLSLSLDIYTSASRPPVGSNYSNSGARAIGLPGRRRERARVRRARKNNERANTNTVGQTPFGMNVPPICYIGPEINMRSEMVRARREIWALLPRRLGKCYSVSGLILITFHILTLLFTSVCKNKSCPS